jgi:predicted O-methyltransferase YrrM
MHRNNSGRRLAQAFLGMNLATLIRAARRGPFDAASRAVEAYRAVEPLGGASRRATVSNHDPGPPDRPGRGDPREDREAVAMLGEIPRVGLEDLAPPRTTIIIDGGWGYTDGGLPLSDAMPLLTVLRDRRPRSIVEIGTFHGETTRLLALNCPDATVHTVDLPPTFDVAKDAGALPLDDLHLIAQRSRVGEAYRGLPNVVQQFADTAGWDWEPARGADFFFIDGAHTYDYMKSDTDRAMEVAGRGATIAWHDVDAVHPGVVRRLVEMVREGRDIKAIRGTSLAFLDLKA